MAVSKWLRQQTAEFYVKGIQNLVLNFFYIYLSNARSWL